MHIDMSCNIETPDKETAEGISQHEHKVHYVYSGQRIIQIHSNLIKIWSNYKIKNDQCNAHTQAKSEPNHI